MISTKRISLAIILMAISLLSALVSAQSLTVNYPTHKTVSPRMVDLVGNSSADQNNPKEIRHPFLPHQGGDPQKADGASHFNATPLVGVALLVTATSGASFDGMSVNDGGYIPSDNNIAVGPSHVVEVVNAAFAVYSKAGTRLLGPVPLNNLWAYLAGSPCASNNSGDTVVQYDRMADRWMVTQLGSLSSPYSECIAVSKTNDPTGAYYLYSYGFGSNLNDYPKWGVWPTATNSAYLATYNLFANGSTFAGAQICAYDRTAMLSGAANPVALCYAGVTGASYLPVDLDGATPPVDGTPAYFMSLYGSSLGVYTLAPNFASKTATLSGFSTIPVAPYTQASFSPQPGTRNTLDSLSDRLMYRLAFRRFADHESIVTNHSVATLSGNSGVRWYELQAPVSSAGAFALYQQGTFAPDSSYRWMGSAAMDRSGDIAIGYSVSSGGSSGGSVYPSVRYTGRTPGDPLNMMESEATIINGSGSQTGYSRWGDYSSMRIDPSDDCTFWYVNEYLPQTSSAGWYTRIGSFKFSNCAAGADFSISATPASASIAPGATANSTITVSPLNSYAGTVNMSVSGCPANATCSLNPNTVVAGSGTSALSMTSSAATSAGTYPLVVTGVDTAMNLSHSTTFTAIIVSSNFSLSTTPLSQSVTQGSSTTYSVAVNPSGGFAGTVKFSANGLPSGANASFSPASVTMSGTSTMTVTTSSTTPTGSYVFSITATSGTLTHTITATLVVVAPAVADFALALTPTSQSVSLGQGTTYTTNITRTGGFTGSVALSVSGLGSGVTSAFSPNPASGTSSTLTLTTNTSATPGSWPFTVSGTGAGLSRTAIGTLVITRCSSSSGSC